MQTLGMPGSGRWICWCSCRLDMWTDREVASPSLPQTLRTVSAAMLEQHRWCHKYPANMENSINFHKMTRTVQIFSLYMNIAHPNTPSFTTTAPVMHVAVRPSQNQAFWIYLILIFHIIFIGTVIEFSYHWMRLQSWKIKALFFIFSFLFLFIHYPDHTMSCCGKSKFVDAFIF